MKFKHTRASALMLAMSGLSCIVMAQGNQEHRYRPDQRGKVTQAHRAQHLELDQRYHHDHYYPRQGYPMTILPGGSIGIHFRNGQFYFHGGVWFRPIGSRFVVSLPPLGIVVPVLPPAVVTLWIAGAPYYYANGGVLRHHPRPGLHSCGTTVGCHNRPADNANSGAIAHTYCSARSHASTHHLPSQRSKRRANRDRPTGVQPLGHHPAHAFGRCRSVPASSSCLYGWTRSQLALTDHE